MRESIIIPAHKRTIFVNLYGDTCKFVVQVPDMELVKKEHYECFGYYSYLYYPVIDGKKYLSPFPNTNCGGKICLGLGDLDAAAYPFDFLLNRIYTSVWTDSDGHSSWREYSTSLLTHLHKWQEIGIELKKDRYK